MYVHIVKFYFCSVIKVEQKPVTLKQNQIVLDKSKEEKLKKNFVIIKD